MKNNKFTNIKIKGQSPHLTLPEGFALVLEGGGTRGFYSAGVFEAFMENGIMFPYIVGVSAGAANAITYIAGQKNRNRHIIEHFVSDKRYVSIQNFISHGSIFNMDFIFHTIPQKYIPLDWSIFNKQYTRFLTGAMDCSTGKTIWFEKDDINSLFETTIASCSIPILSPIVTHKDQYELLDGGISDPIPIEQSIRDGNKFHVIILTRNEGYIKKPFKYKSLLKIVYNHYPAVTKAILKRHEIYNKQLAICKALEYEGKAIIIRPQKPLSINRFSSDKNKLLSLYEDGYNDGRIAVKRLLTKFKPLF